MSSHFTHRLLASASLLLLTSALHAQIGPGDLVTGFGDGDGYKRIEFNDISGGGPNDSARDIVLIRAPLGGVSKILVAGVVGGRRIGIAQLFGNGSLDSGFGNGGRALSTRTNISSFAGMERMPNGDIVIGYADDYTGEDDSRDFFIEVFSANGQPKNIGGPEFPNQRFVDLSTDQDADNGFACDELYRRAYATSVTLTVTNNILLVGQQDFGLAGPFFKVYVFAEFDAASYAPARAPWGMDVNCRSAGGGTAGALNASEYFARDIWAGAGGSVHIAGDQLTDGGDSVGHQKNALLGTTSGNGPYSSSMPSGFWSNAQSAFNRINVEPTNTANPFLLFGEREQGTFGSGVRLSPLIASARGNIMTPLFFLPLGTAATSTITLLDGARFENSEQIWVLGSAVSCNAANNCARNWDSWVAGVSTGAALFTSYLPDTRFGIDGWVRNNVPNYDQATPTPRSFAWRAAINTSAGVLGSTDLYIVGDFAYDLASNDFDWFVAKLRVFNSELVGPLQGIFADGFE